MTATRQKQDNTRYDLGAKSDNQNGKMAEKAVSDGLEQMVWNKMAGKLKAEERGSTEELALFFRGSTFTRKKVTSRTFVFPSICSQQSGNTSRFESVCSGNWFLVLGSGSRK